VDLVWFRSRLELPSITARYIFSLSCVAQTWITVEKNGRPEVAFEGVESNVESKFEAHTYEINADPHCCGEHSNLMGPKYEKCDGRIRIREINSCTHGYE
jgi:hypothetical protein